jgi:trypsin
LLHFKEKIKFTDTIKAIDYDWKEVPEGAMVRLTGWGLLSASGSLPDQLQKIDLKHISYGECKLARYNSNVDYGHFCTYNKPGEAACNGDR